MHKPKPRPAGERRTQVRYPHRSEVWCRPLGAGEEASWLATLKDLSRGGATLLTDREVCPGAVLEVTLPGHGGRFSQPVLMRVRNVRASKDATWLAGCSFVRALAAHDLEALLESDLIRAARKR